MSNPIKHSTNQIPYALGTNDMWLGVNDSIIFPPSESTGWWSGYSPGPSGYTIFIQKPSQGPSIYSPANDSELITTVFRLAKSKGEFPTLNNVQDALDWLANQNETICVNFDYPSIITDGLIFLADSAFTASYPKGGNTWKDVSGSGNHATLVNGPNYSSQYQGILDFDSALLQYATGPELGTLSNFTISCWVKLTTLPTTSGAAAIVTNVYDLSTKLNFSIGLNRSPSSSNVCFGFFDGSWRTTNGFAPSTNTWYNIVGTYDGSNIRQYVNGVENTTLSYSGTAQSSGLGIRIARRWDATEISDNFIDGQIPVVKIYNRALTDSEILLNYNSLTPRFPQPITTTTSTTSTSTTSTSTTSTSTTSTTTAPPTSTTSTSTTSTSTSTTSTSSSTTTTTIQGEPVTNNLVLYYDPSNVSSYPGTGTTVNDLSGNGLSGTMSNITFTSPYFTYNGSSSQISTADTPSLEPGSGDWSMEAWVYLSNTTGSKVILGRFNNGGGSDDVSYSMRVSGANIFAQFGDGSGSFVNSTGFTASINTWYQVVYVWKNVSVNNIETFINGTSIGNVSHSLPSLLNSTNPMYIGSYNGGEFSQYMNGRIGITRLYNVALTSSEVLQNFNADKSKYGLITTTSTTTSTTTAPPTTTSTSSTSSSTTTTTTSSGGIINTNLFMHLDASDPTSYPGSGSTWYDLTANSNNGSISGSTWASTDGGLFDFDGVNDSISVAHNSSLSLSTTVQRTVQVWVKFDSIPAINTQVPVFGKLSSSSGFDGYWGGLFSDSGVVRCVTNGTSVQKISNSTLTITTGVWYLMTFVSQITSTIGSTKVYINETEYISTEHGTDTYSESNPFYLGFIGSGVGSLYLDGKIGACYFYTSGLSAANVSTNFNATRSRYGV